MNKEYWSNFYANVTPPINPSPFTEFVSLYVDKSSSILDIGCGNGRDTRYFENLGYKIKGFDLIPVKNFLGSSFIQGDVTQSIPKKDVYYCRFFLHTLTEDSLDKFLDNICKISPYSTIFIETRSTRGVTDEDKSETNFKSSIGDEHFRMLYSMKYLYDKLEEKFDVSYICESNTFSVYGSDSPYLIRVIASPKLTYKINRKNLKKITSLFEKYNIDYVAFYGTLLGLGREGDLIPHDDDIDLLVDLSYYDKVYELIFLSGEFPNIHWFVGDDNTFINFHNGDNITTDIYFYSTTKDNYFIDKFNFTAQIHDKNKHLHIPKDLILEKKYFDMGDFKVKVPKKLDETCKFLYGERYKEKLIKGVDYTSNITNNKPNHIYYEINKHTK